MFPSALPLPTPLWVQPPQKCQVCSHHPSPPTTHPWYSSSGSFWPNLDACAHVWPPVMMHVCAVSAKLVAEGSPGGLTYFSSPSTLSCTLHSSRCWSSAFFTLRVNCIIFSLLVALLYCFCACVTCVTVSSAVPISFQQPLTK
eukprot:RCo052338